MTFLDLGRMPLAGGFLRDRDIAHERLYPLTLQFCRRCTLVQAAEVVSPDVLFKNYFYFSSAIGTLVDHFTALADEVVGLMAATRNPFVVEIGCNDGVFLKPLAARGIRAVGVDPATNVVRSAEGDGLVIVNDYFTESLARRLRQESGPADVVVSSYSFAHIDDIVDVMKGIDVLLKDDGVLVIEIYYLGTLLDELQYDMMYHEHMSYYSLTALQNFFQRFGMEVVGVERIPLRAGTVRLLVSRAGDGKKAVGSVAELLAMERDRGLHQAETYLSYGAKVDETRRQLLCLLDELRDAGQRVVGYGASGRATVIMNYCGIDGRYLEAVVDDAPAKHGYYTPGTHLPIVPWETIAPSRPPYMLLFAWSFLAEVKRRRAAYLQAGGKFIVPLPTPMVVSG